MFVNNTFQKKGTRKRKSCLRIGDSRALTDASTETESVEVTRAENPLESQDDTPLTKKRSFAGLYRAPTHNELLALKETENLFNSNLMKLQITELLQEVGLPSKGKAAINSVLHSLRDVLMQLAPSEPVELASSLSLLPETVDYPLRLSLKGVKGQFQFLPPCKIKVIGSHLLGTGIQCHQNVDLSLTIPDKCCQAKDVLNFRYFHKRALYLCCVAGQLQKMMKSSFTSMSFSHSMGSPLLPLLVLHPSDPEAQHYVIQIHTNIPDDYFSFSKLLPNKSNVRNSAVGVSSGEEVVAKTTPLYNTFLRLEAGARERHLEELFAAGLECPGIQDAVRLCKVWLKQRHLQQSWGGFTGFHCAMLLMHLLALGRIGQLMSCYQLLRVMMQFIVTSDWTVDGVCMANREKFPTLPPMEVFHQSFEVVFLDSSGLLNLTACMSRAQYFQLKHEAHQALALLEDSTQFGFQSLFMQEVPMLLKFDILFHVKLEASLLDDAGWYDAQTGLAGWAEPVILQKLLPILERGLGKRAQLIGQEPYPCIQWPVEKSPPLTSKGYVTLGLLYDSAHSFNPLERGPPADSAEASDFRKWWGECSELRRFADGSIHEAVVWNGEATTSGRRTVPEQIVQQLLLRHMGVSAHGITSTGPVLDQLLHRSCYASSAPTAGFLSTGEEQNVEVLKVFAELSRQLRQLKGIPLAVTATQGSSPVFRHAEVFPPVPWSGKLSVVLRATPSKTVQAGCFYPSCDVASPGFTPALDVVLEMESSGKWPNQVAAINYVKTALYISIAQNLRQQYGLVAAPTTNHLDVLKKGYVFRLRIHYPRQLVLMREMTDKIWPSHSSCNTLEKTEEQMVTSPLLSSTLFGLQQEFPAFGVGVRLCKRWVSAHLLTGYVREEAVELMVAHLCLHPQPFTPPSSPVVMLLRFLLLLSSHSWKTDPLIINFNQSLSDEDIADILARFSQQRPQLPAMVLFSPLDHIHSHWTKDTPPPIVCRLVILARVSLSLLSTQLVQPQWLEPEPTDFMQAFRTPLSHFDVVIHLHKRHVVCGMQHVPTRSSTVRYKHLPVVGFDPVQCYIEELQVAFSDIAWFFHDKHGGLVIGVAWKPDALTPRSFKAKQSHCRVPCSGGKDRDNLVLDKEAVIADFKLMGAGLVKTIQVLCK